MITTEVLFDYTVISLSTLLFAIGTISTVLLVHFIFTHIFSYSFKRDVHKKTFNTVSDVTSLLSNPDSVLSREKVEDSIAGYETLFAGARKKIGTTSTADSIKNRAKEYQTMVTSFYDLVTDFYEWGWGQVSYEMILFHQVI